MFFQKEINWSVALQITIQDTNFDNLINHGFIDTQPTSSTRTLLTEDTNSNAYIKTHLDKKHFRFIRRLRLDSIEHSIRVSDDLREMFLKGDFYEKYSYFPESLGFAIKDGEYKNLAVLFRDSEPFPKNNKKSVIIPYHSLYAHDQFNRQDKPLLCQLVRLHSTGDELKYFIEEIVAPILETWVSLVSKRWLLPELHGQNTLVEIDQNYKINRIIQRDFQSLYSDSDIRGKLKLKSLKKHIVGEEEGTTVKSQYSLVFDRFIGKYLIDRMVKVFCKEFGYNIKDVQNEIKKFHHSIDGWQVAKFPATVYKFNRRSLDQIGNSVKLITDGELPTYR